MAKQRPPLEEMTLRQLRKVASELQISKYSRMRKAQLQAAIKAKLNKTEEKLEQSSLPVQEEQHVEATKFEVGQKASTDDAFPI